MLRLRYPAHWLILLALLAAATGYSVLSVMARGLDAPLAQPPNWWDTNWPYRLPLAANANGTARTDKVVDFPVNFTQQLATYGVSGAFDPASLRVIEVDGSGNALDVNVPFQFDPATNYNATTNAAGTLVVQLRGTTAANATRNYHAYFALAGSGVSAPTFPAQLTLTDDVMDEGQSSYRIATQSGTYFYQKEAAAFSSLVDRNGNDWLNYHPTGGAGGSYRGIPNMIYPEGKFHPGDSSATSTVRNEGPLKITVHSLTNDGKWEALWEFYPTYARMTLLKKDHNYWFLYEGTPGGSIEGESDFVMRADGTQTTLNTAWSGDLSGAEWLYFADPVVDRALFVANHANDTLT
ncbi:MAG: hypothetical protein KDE58_16075, partial [Caldilineaceae bacterium]|nr:hypothetical protein [Caldilineaceae bacterium]